MTSTESETTVTRDQLARNGFDPGKATGVLHVDSVASAAFPLASGDRAAAVDIAAETLRAAGVTERDRVVVALNNDGEPSGTIIAEAAATVGSAAASVGPRGRMRLLRSIERIRASALVITPTGLADFLARLHLEFLVDPLDLELRRILVIGEIADRGALSHLASEFGATVVQLFGDPVSGLPLGHQELAASELTVTRGDLIELAAPTAASTGEDLNEICVRHRWHSTLADTVVRTGYLCAGDLPAMPTRTYGDNLLARGRWIPLSAVTKALRGIDGIAHWELRVARPGTLDTVSLVVDFNRASLIGNGMWQGRIQQAINAITPVTIDVEVNPDVREQNAPPTIRDDRGHHIHS